MFSGMGNFKKTFSSAQEEELVEYIKLMESRLFGLTTKDLRRLAFQLAEKNNIKHTFNQGDQMAGLDWLKGFLKRHPDLSLRNPEPTSAARAIGFNKTAVSCFYQNLIYCLDKYKMPPHRIYNVDETGITTVPKSHSKIIAQKGRRQVGTLVSAERGQTVTATLCFSATGHYVPPLLILPRVRMKPELLDGAPPGTVAVCHPSGWMQTDIFLQWMKHFTKHVKPSKDDPVLLLLDGHITHTKSIEVIDWGRVHGIVMLCLPPHCTHRLQPLDVSFMGPLSSYYSQGVKTWLRNNPGRIVTQYQIAKLFGLAFAKAATIETAMSGFRKTGIYPTDPHIFKDIDFAPADTTERMEDDSQTDKASNDVEEISTVIVEDRAEDKRKETEGNKKNISQDVVVEQGPSSAFPVSPKDIIAVPHSAVRRSSNRRRGKTVVLTESPYKNELLEIIEKSNKTNTKAVKRKILLKKEKVNKATKKLVLSSSEEDEEREMVDSDHDAICLYCKKNYFSTEKNDGWVQCLQCQNWAHEGCTGVEGIFLDKFKCDFCTGFIDTR